MRDGCQWAEGVGEGGAGGGGRDRRETGRINSEETPQVRGTGDRERGREGERGKREKGGERGSKVVESPNESERDSA